MANEIKYTSGLWKKQPQRVNEPTEIQDDKGNMLAFVPVVGTPDDPLEQEYQQNALFMAAASRMYEALKQVELYARVNHDRPKDYGEIVADAIALAEKGKIK